MPALSLTQSRPAETTLDFLDNVRADWGGVVTLAYGDIYLAANGPYSSKPRPVIILQNPSLNSGDSVIVVPLTSVDNPDISTRLAIHPTAANGLDRECFAEVDKLSAIKVSALGPRVGTLEAPLQQEIADTAVKLVTVSPTSGR